MHPEAHAWIAQTVATGEELAVLDIGGRDINGTVADLFPAAAPYDALDIRADAGVAIVADAATWTPHRSYDLVVSTECFEHTPDWRLIVGTAFAALRPGGIFAATMAAPGRPPHSGIDGGPLREEEHYANIAPADLVEALTAAGFVDVVIDVQQAPHDLRCTARRGEDNPTPRQPRRDRS